MERRWIVPTVILLLLILAGVFRWSVEAQTTTDGEVTKWKRDRWTGALWLSNYNAGNSYEVLANIYRLGEQSELSDISNKAHRVRDVLAMIWYSLTGIFAVWTFVEVMKTIRLKDKGKETPA